MKYGFLAFLLILLYSNVFSQVNCVTDPPLAPKLTTVSVTPETGFTSLTWTLSPSADIAAYIVYAYRNGDGLPIDTIRDPAATSVVLQNTASKYFSVSYVVAAMRLPRCTSIFSNVLNSIFTEAIIDTCHNKINVSWNTYPSDPAKVISYSVLASINGSSYSELTTVTPDTKAFTLNNFTIDADYCFYIRANLENGAFSSSNKSCVLTRLQRPPDWINADQATINADGKVAVSFTIDPLSEINHFILERKTGQDGTFKEISRPVSSGGKVNYTDEKAKTDSVNYYRLSAINSCGIPIIVSNQASNLVLSSEISGSNIVLKWNPYEKWQGNISAYHIYVNTGDGFSEKGVILPPDTVFLQDYQQIMYNISGDEVCFYVIAIEESNPHMITGESHSQSVCIAPVERITVPNVFTPNNDLENDLFRPVLSFAPKDYHLTISDRKGVLLFETRDYLESWDGFKNGSPQSETVCLWFLKVTTPSGKVISKTGTVTLIR